MKHIQSHTHTNTNTNTNTNYHPIDTRLSNLLHSYTSSTTFTVNPPCRLGKVLQEVGVTVGTEAGTGMGTEQAQGRLSYRQWLAVLVSLADSGFPALPSPAHRVARLLHCMEMTGDPPVPV